MNSSRNRGIDRGLTRESFDALIEWLDSDREQAAYKYEEIRRRLITIFIRRGCQNAEDLADETINRVAGKTTEFSNSFTGDPARYFYAVAKSVYLESAVGSKPNTTLSSPALDERRDDVELRYRCLDKCLESLSPENRNLMVHYFQEEKGAKTNARRELANTLGITVNTLRIRVHRVRAALERCLSECMNASRHE